jgi:diguanylate cyclase (GGDEF)-like protein
MESDRPSDNAFAAEPAELDAVPIVPAPREAAPGDKISADAAPLETVTAEENSADPGSIEAAPIDEIPAAAAAADPAAAAEVEQLKDRLTEARRALNLVVSIVNALPVNVTVKAADGSMVFANDPAAPTDVTLSEENVAGADGERTLLKSCRPARILDRDLTLSTALDFTERKRIETELSERAYLDDLTGLPNRALIQEHVEQLLTASDVRPRFALAFLDIDNFKHINDYYTHAIGDTLLVKVAQRIAAQIRPCDVVGRISGDEFLLVLNPVENDDELGDVVGRLLQELKEPFLIEGYEILTSASIGVSVCPDHGLNYETLRRAADTAMYRIKAGSKGGAVLFDSDMGRDMTVRMAQEQRLRLAVRDGRFCCAFQPKVDIRTQEVVGVEALIRLRDEDGVIQAPGQFIGLATELGLIDDLTYLAFGQIVGSMELLDEAFGLNATVSINVAAQQAGDLKFMRGFCEELAATRHAERFIVEVTEDAFVAKSRFQTEVLPMLRDIGVRVSVDDFGTGYSSLAVLADITADEIKIDRSFITDIHKRSRSQSILKAIEALSEALGMTVIAEGVETFEEAAYLQAATRIRYAQGFHYSKPIFLEELVPARSGLNTARSLETPRERASMRGQMLTRR